MSLKKIPIQIWICLYSLGFLLIRTTASITEMTPDETEQMTDSANFYLGYNDQPPMYSWLLFLISRVTGLNTIMMICVYHAIVCLFYLAWYKCLREIWNEKQSNFVFLTTILFFIYSYDFFRYTIHTTLMCLFVALSIYFYVKILKTKNSKYYLLLGLCFALGILSKYNFIFAIMTLIFSSIVTKEGREILFTRQSLLAIAPCVLILLPHIIWLKNHDFVALHYALNRGEAGQAKADIIAVLLNTYWNYLVYIATIGLIGFKAIESKQQKLLSNFKYMGLFAILIPLAVIIIFQTANFSQRWLAPTNLFIILACMSFINIEKIDSKLIKLFYLAVSIMIIAFYAARIISYFG
jgi:4-amino-4-deoxy-L-arabinose transferase-like glycosyltransferase